MGEESIGSLETNNSERSRQLFGRTAASNAGWRLGRNERLAGLLAS
jgi:hypothetical protein